MYELKMGELRYIMEITRPWQMYMDPILAKMEDDKTKARETINAYEEMYTKEFQEYYVKRKTEDEGLHGDEIYGEFEEMFRKDHPEFYDVDEIFSSCTEEDKKRAEKQLSDAREALK